MKRLTEATEQTILDSQGLLHVYDGASVLDKKITVGNLIRSWDSRNDIINGSLNIWQRQISFTGITTGSYHGDRFRYDKSGVMVHDITRSTDVPSSAPNLLYSLKVDCTTADTSIAAGEYCILGHYIEGYNFKKYVGNYGTLGFWVKSAKTGVHCISVINSGNNRSYISEYTVSVANTWEYKTIVTPFNFSGGTWNYTNGIGLKIYWTLAAGTSWHGTKDIWNSSNYLSTSNQVNVCDNTANDFYLAGITFNIGKVPIIESRVNIGLELVRCQRYYEKSYNNDVYPGTVTSVGALVGRQSSLSRYITLQKAFAAKKRVTPTVVWYSDNTGTANRVYDNTVPGDHVVGSTLFAGEYSSGIPYVSAPGAPDASVMSAHYTIDAEL